jgi:hypothetical protein
MSKLPATLIIACGALARELTGVIKANGWRHIEVTCLPAHLHNTPAKIPEAVRRKIRQHRDAYQHISVLYGDCGTGGKLDAVLAEEGVERIPGAHCYEFYMGSTDFDALAEAEPGTFFLTDYLVRHFDRLIYRGLGLDRYPELRDDYFRHYDKLVYLSQVRDPELERQAAAAARRLGLQMEHRHTGLAGLETFVTSGGALARQERAQR